ncbi:hypothetical protein Stsp02_57800 [Streptomyces sp. NBRC 14336]|nr:hypothetical protein Stsp02_57800 [Streptomyces sp. NBRC 14336]
MQGLLDLLDGLGGQRLGEVDVVDVGTDVAGDAADGELAHGCGVLSGMAETGVADMGVADMGVADMGVADMGVAGTGLADTGIRPARV